MREKERRGNVIILLPHVCFRVAPCSSYKESLELSLSYTSGNFHYRTWLVYSDDGLPQMPEVFMSDTSILHHAFISIFIALWDVITRYVTILMPILSYFTRF